MKKPLSGGVITGVLIAVLIIVAVLAWKFVIAPPPRAELPKITKEQQELHARSAQDIMAQQRRLVGAARGGGQ
ncbi:MAG TPA: hypothetical protein VFB38_02010 [Chthonomonadaceae bacterium]|nr:hypothetical protein [Chthonomonadaceae bacterium]